LPVTVHEFTPNQATITDATIAGGIATVLNGIGGAPILAVTAYACQGNIYVVVVQ